MQWVRQIGMAGLLANVARRALWQQASSSAASSSAVSCLLASQGRPFSSAPGEESEQQQQDVSSIGNEKVQRLADEIVGLSVLECSWLSEILRKKLNMERPAFGGMPMMGAMPMMAAPGGAPAAGGGDAAPAAEEKKEKTEFAVKLEAFSAEGKIKVIKEIRTITNLGLKEAKELVRVLGGEGRARRPSASHAARTHVQRGGAALARRIHQPCSSCAVASAPARPEFGALCMRRPQSRPSGGEGAHSGQVWPQQSGRRGDAEAAGRRCGCRACACLAHAPARGVHCLRCASRQAACGRGHRSLAPLASPPLLTVGATIKLE